MSRLHHFSCPLLTIANYILNMYDIRFHLSGHLNFPINAFTMVLTKIVELVNEAIFTTCIMEIMENTDVYVDLMWCNWRRKRHALN